MINERKSEVTFSVMSKESKCHEEYIYNSINSILFEVFTLIQGINTYFALTSTKSISLIELHKNLICYLN